MYIIMELAEGGDLYDRMLSLGRSYSEQDVVDAFKPLVSAVAYCHDNGVVVGAGDGGEWEAGDEMGSRG